MTESLIITNEKTNYYSHPLSQQTDHNISFEELINLWIEEELKPGILSNGTVMSYQGVIKKIKEHPIARMQLKDITPDILQKYIDTLCKPQGTRRSRLSTGYLNIYTAVLNNLFRFAVFPKKYITFNPMEYVRTHRRNTRPDIFSERTDISGTVPVITHDQYLEMINYLEKRKNPAKLPFQIAYYTGLRLGEVCGLIWQDIDLDKQYMTVRRSMRYNNIRHKVELGTTKRSKVRTVYFGDTLTEILRTEKFIQQEKFNDYKNYYQIVYENGREYYELNTLHSEIDVPVDFTELSLVCIRDDGRPESPDTISIVCRSLRKRFKDLEGFHFHTLRHTYTSNLISAGASPKDVQELLGHSDISVTMNVYAHSDREKKQNSVRLLDNI